jgi:alkylation response protein AidB-like acyl-CoA dehydrogenase
VDISLNESQKMLKSSAHDFLKRECPWTVVKQIDESPDGFSIDLWQKISDMGWPAMIFPEKCGGMGSCLTDLAMIYEEMGQALVPGIFFSSSILCGSIIAAAGSEQQQAQILPTIAEGKAIFSLALTESDYGWGPECVHLSAKLAGGNYTLKGTKRFVSDANVADYFIVVARTSEGSVPSQGLTLFTVPRNARGLTIRSISAFSSERYFELTFDSVEVEPSAVLGVANQGWSALAVPLNRATAILCTYMVGGCQRLLEMTVQYAQTRVQFGQPIGAFQWVQGYIIEQANQLERARWFTYEALWKLDSNQPEKEQSEAVALAKAVASEAFLECGHLGHEVHAGLGVDKKYPLYLYSKSSKTLYSYLGNPNYHRQRVAEILGL